MGQGNLQRVYIIYEIRVDSPLDPIPKSFQLVLSFKHIWITKEEVKVQSNCQLPKNTTIIQGLSSRLLVEVRSSRFDCETIATCLPFTKDAANNENALKARGEKGNDASSMIPSCVIPFLSLRLNRFGPLHTFAYEWNM